MLNAPARKASASPSPMMISGTARTRVAEVIAYQEPNAPDQSARNAGPDSYPDSSSPAASANNPARSAAAPTTHPDGRTEPQPPASMSAPSSSLVAPAGPSSSVPLRAITIRVASASTSSRSL